MLDYFQFPPPLTAAQRDAVSWVPTATNSGINFYLVAAVGFGSVTSLWASVKGRPLRGGCFPSSFSKSWNRPWRYVPVIRHTVLQKGACIHCSNGGAHGCRWHRRILLLPGTSAPPSWIHTDWCIRFSGCWNTVPSAHCRTGISLCSCSGSHQRIHRIPQMLLMCTGFPSRCAGSALSWNPAVNPKPFARWGLQGSLVMLRSVMLATTLRSWRSMMVQL